MPMIISCGKAADMHGWKWAVFCPENFPADDFYDDLIEMYVGKHVTAAYGQQMTEEEYSEACDFIDAHIFFIYPDDNHTIETLHDRFHFLIMSEGIDGVIVDPYNQIDKFRTGERSDEEVSGFMNTVNRFAIDHHIVYNIVAHPKNLSLGKGVEFKAADMHDLALGALWGNKAFNIVSYHRPEWFTNRLDPNVGVVIQKIKRRRTGGKWGTVKFKWEFLCSRFYSDASGERKYFCDPSRRASRDMNAKWESEYAELPPSTPKAVQANIGFYDLSSQDAKDKKQPLTVEDIEPDPLNPLGDTITLPVTDDSPPPF